MMNRPRLKKDKKIEGDTIKDVRNLFGLKKIDDATSKDVRNLFRLIKENQAIKDRRIIDIRNLFEHKEECYYK